MKARITASEHPDRAAGRQSAGRPALRLAVLSSPWTGNTWLRRLLDGVYGLPQAVVDLPGQIDWAQLSRTDGCILQIHWAAERWLVERLASGGFQKITLLRHPLDVLLSILHSASVWPDTAAWFGGRGGDESSIVGVAPRSPQFLSYAASPRARCLLSISPQWMRRADCLTVRYERLVEDPVGELQRLTERLEPVPAEAVEAAVAANTLEKLREKVGDQHFWQGKPGNWRQLLPAREARQIADAYRWLFQETGYVCDPDPALDDRQADANWFALELATLREEFRQARTQLRQSQDARREWDSRLSETEARLYDAAVDLSGRLDHLAARVGPLEILLAGLQSEIEPLRAVGSTSLGLARRLTHLSVRFPKVASAVKRCAGPLRGRRAA